MSTLLQARGNQHAAQYLQGSSLTRHEAGFVYIRGLCDLQALLKRQNNASSAEQTTRMERRGQAMVHSLPPPQCGWCACACTTPLTSCCSESFGGSKLRGNCQTVTCQPVRTTV